MASDFVVIKRLPKNRLGQDTTYTIDKILYFDNELELSDFINQEAEELDSDIKEQLYQRITIIVVDSLIHPHLYVEYPVREKEEE